MKPKCAATLTLIESVLNAYSHSAMLVTGKLCWSAWKRVEAASCVTRQRKLIEGAAAQQPLTNLETTNATAHILRDTTRTIATTNRQEHLPTTVVSSMITVEVADSGITTTISLVETLLETPLLESVTNHHGHINVSSLQGLQTCVNKIKAEPGKLPPTHRPNHK
jgi:hypothetical protein